MTIETTKWDASEFLDNDEAIAAYLEAAFEDGDSRVIAKALGDVAKAKGMTHIAEEAGISRMGLYKALGENGDPKLSTLLNVIKALGVRLTVSVADKAA